MSCLNRLLGRFDTKSKQCCLRLKRLTPATSIRKLPRESNSVSYAKGSTQPPIPPTYPVHFTGSTVAILFHRSFSLLRRYPDQVVHISLHGDGTRSESVRGTVSGISRDLVDSDTTSLTERQGSRTVLQSWETRTEFRPGRGEGTVTFMGRLSASSSSLLLSLSSTSSFSPPPSCSGATSFFVVFLSDTQVKGKTFLPSTVPGWLTGWASFDVDN